MIRCGVWSEERFIIVVSLVQSRSACRDATSRVPAGDINRRCFFRPAL